MKAGLIALWLVAQAAAAATLPVQVLDRDGQPVADAVVVLTPSRPASPARLLADSATISQDRMRFVPAITVVPVGATLTFTNNDSWEHHVRGTPAGVLQFASTSGVGFEMHLEGKTGARPPMSAQVVMPRAGPVLLGCHIHGSMRGYVYVSDSPWTLKTDAAGMAVFEGLPDGMTQVRVWQADQLVDLAARSVEVAGTAARVEFRLQVVPRRRRDQG